MLKKCVCLSLALLLVCLPLSSQEYYITEEQMTEWEQSLNELENVRNDLNETQKQLETLSKDSATLYQKYEKSKSWNSKLIGALTVSVGVNVAAIIYWVRTMK